ncbi:MAG: hypothetical protein ACRDRX_12080 [Pseudonocardiaceae bacterium]
MDSGGWTSLEIVKLMVSALIPITVVGVGYIVSRATKRLEAVQWANQTVIERRLDIFQQVAPKLNRLLCFAIFVGAWKEVTPADAIRLKRETDEIMYVNRVLFSRTLFDTYLAFTGTLFEIYARRSGNALIRAEIDSSMGTRRHLDWWDDTMEAEFATTDIPRFHEVRAAYDELSDCFRRDLYITREELSQPGS